MFFLALVRQHVGARAEQNSGQTLETDCAPLVEGLSAAAGELAAALIDLKKPMANLAAVHATGEHGVTKDLALSVSWYRRAADKGNGRAAAVLGLMSLRGEGLPQDADEAKKFFARADELGFDVDGYLKGIGFARP